MTSARRAVVTGGTRGIGRGIAAGLAADGAEVTIIGRDAAAGRAVVEELREPGGTAHFVACDLADNDTIGAALATARERMGGIDILCHCAGIYPETALAEMTVTQWNQVLGVNLTSAMVLVREALPALERSPNGRVIMISSITGPRTGIAGLSHYAASKAGLDGFVRAAAVELAPRGITVNAVAPGTILTEGLAELYSDPGVMDSVTAIIPVGRMGTPADIAAAVRYLAAPDSGFVTGQSIVVDGGQTLPEVQGPAS